MNKDVRTLTPHGDFTRRVLIAVSIVALVTAILVLAWRVFQVLLLFFAGTLLAVGLRGLADVIHAHTRLREGWALLLVDVAFFLLLGAAIWLMGPHLMQGLDRLAQDIPQSVQQFTQQLSQVEWLQRLLNHAYSSVKEGLSDKVFSHLAGIFATALGGLTSLLVIIVIGLYLSVDPRVYTHSFILLIPHHRRERTREVLAAQGHSLRWWLLGRISSMTVVGVLTWTGLMALGMPLAFTLAVLAGLLSFVPNIGPIVSALPAVLTALSLGPMMAAYVVLLYIGVQTVESYFITPFIQQRAVSIPPALLLTMQLIMGVWAGVLGVLLATPLAVAIMVAVRLLYIEDVIGDPVGPP